MLKPLQDRVVLEPIEIEKKTSSGIILSGDSTKPLHAEALVIAAGPGRMLDNGEVAPLAVIPGQRVVYEGFAGTKVSHEGKSYVILSEGQILAIIE